MSGLGTGDGVRLQTDGGAQSLRFVARVGPLQPVPGGEAELVGIGDEKIEEAAGIAGQILGSEGHLVQDPSDIGVHHGVEKPVLVAEVRVDQRPVRVRRGFDAVDAGSGDPVGSELRRVEAGMRIGRDLESLLWDIATRIDVPEFRFFIIALSVQRETGGNLAETLANLGDVLRRRRQMRAKVRAMSSETRATTMILGGLPIVVGLLLAITSPAYLRPLLSDVRGLMLDGLALTMLGTGIFIMMKMAKFEI